MPSRFHPIEDGLWDDPKFDATPTRPEAPGEERGFFAFLSSNKMQRAAGIYRATDEELSAASRIPVKRVRLYLADLQARDLIVRDGAWIFCPGYWKRQAHNPGFVKSARLCVVSCSSYAVQASFIQHYPLHKEWLPNGCPMVSQPSSEIAPAVSEAVSEEQQSSNRGTTEHTTCLALQVPEWPSPESLQTLYNQTAPEYLPRATTLNPQRRKTLSTYLRAYPDRSWWETVFAEYALSRFLLGMERSNGHAGFKPDLDWLCRVGKDKVDNCVKVHDGKYRDPPTPLLTEKTKGNIAAMEVFVKGSIHE